LIENNIEYRGELIFDTNMTDGVEKTIGQHYHENAWVVA
jgi:hypothetical protein